MGPNSFISWTILLKLCTNIILAQPSKSLLKILFTKKGTVLKLYVKTTAAAEKKGKYRKGVKYRQPGCKTTAHSAM